MSQEVLSRQTHRFLTIGMPLKPRQIAYCHAQGSRDAVGLFWLGGFKSSMNAIKASALAQWAQTSGRSVTRMDYSGHGVSGGVFDDATISDWLEEARAVFMQVTAGPQILVGSSMGGWLALLLAQSLKSAKRIAGLVLIAPAWDMTERLMWQQFSDQIKQGIKDEGFFLRPSAYGDGDYRITGKLIEDGRQHLIGDRALHLGCPLHVLHGGKDQDVPWQHGHALLSLLPRDAVQFTFIPDGDHRLSRLQDITLMIKAIESLAIGPANPVASGSI